MKKILLLSDTHGYIGDDIIKYVMQADEVWHAGDIGDLKVTDEIKKHKPLKAVFGNIDDAKVRMEFPEHHKFKCEDVRVWITHIGGYPNRYDTRVREEVLRGISLDVKSGDTVAIVGATGAGKSTIINLLNRFYDIDSGEIRIDNINIKDVTLYSLRKQIAVVLQDVFLFADTILNNITLKSPEISEAQVEAAARQIGIHEFIMSLPNGYHYNVKERGVMLSSGQRQLISFLRAYVTNPGILILDEATSSVDSYSEQLIQEATDKITKGRTSIVIAHRLATVKKADNIIVMDAGQIVEQGTHKELLKKADGYYKNLYEVQFMQEEVA